MTMTMTTDEKRINRKQNRKKNYRIIITNDHPSFHFIAFCQNLYHTHECENYIANIHGYGFSFIYVSTTCTNRFGPVFNGYFTFIHRYR